MKRFFLWVLPMLLISMFFLNSNGAYGCTGIRIKAADGSVVCGRTMEFGDVFGFIFVAVPAKTNYPAFENQEESALYDGMRWTSKYAVAGIATKMDPQSVTEGINEKGLSAGGFYHKPLARYQTPSGKDLLKAVGVGSVISYLLGNYANVDEIVTAIKASSFFVRDEFFVFKNAQGQPADSLQLQLHYFINDVSGKTLVIEYLNGKVVIDTSNIGVITNCPAYSWHVQNLSNYINLHADNTDTYHPDGADYVIRKTGNGSGMLGLPGDFTPPSRFVRAYFLTKNMEKASGAEEAVYNVFHVLNSFDIAKGYIGVGDDIPEQTLWTSASDLKNVRFYYHTYNDRQIKVFDLKKNLSKLGAAVVVLDDQISTGKQSVREIEIR